MYIIKLEICISSNTGSLKVWKQDSGKLSIKIKCESECIFIKCKGNTIKNAIESYNPLK